MKGRIIALLAAGLLLLSGCTKSEPTVTGVVRMDGELLPNGSITFFPVNDRGEIAGDHGPDRSAKIREGNYRIDAGLMVGRYRVDIDGGTRKIPRKVLDPVYRVDLINEEVAVIPAKYNRNSNLIKEIHEGSNTLNFDLESIKRSP